MKFRTGVGVIPYRILLRTSSSGVGNKLVWGRERRRIGSGTKKEKVGNEEGKGRERRRKESGTRQDASYIIIADKRRLEFRDKVMQARDCSERNLSKNRKPRQRTQPRHIERPRGRRM